MKFLLLLFLGLNLVGASNECPIANDNFEIAGSKKTLAKNFTLKGDAQRFSYETQYETGSFAIKLDSANDLNRDREKAGEVSQLIKLPKLKQHWYRFSFRGLAQTQFKISQEKDLFIKVNFYAKNRYRDHVKYEFYHQILRDRKDIDVNGVNLKYGSAVWRDYYFDFRTPFSEIDSVRITVGFKSGNSSNKQYAKGFP